MPDPDEQVSAEAAAADAAADDAPTDDAAADDAAADDAAAEDAAADDAPADAPAAAGAAPDAASADAAAADAAAADAPAAEPTAADAAATTDAPPAPGGSHPPASAASMSMDGDGLTSMFDGAAEADDSDIDAADADLDGKADFYDDLERASKSQAQEFLRLQREREAAQADEADGDGVHHSLTLDVDAFFENEKKDAREAAVDERKELGTQDTFERLEALLAADEEFIKAAVHDAGYDQPTVAEAGDIFRETLALVEGREAPAPSTPPDSASAEDKVGTPPDSATSATDGEHAQPPPPRDLEEQVADLRNTLHELGKARAETGRPLPNRDPHAGEHFFKEMKKGMTAEQMLKKMNKKRMEMLDEEKRRREDAEREAAERALEEQEAEQVAFEQAAAAKKQQIDNSFFTSPEKFVGLTFNALGVGGASPKAGEGESDDENERKALEEARRKQRERYEKRKQQAMVDTDVKAMKHGLRVKYGNLITAWYVLDRHQKGRLNLRDFCDAVRDLGWKGPLKKIFNLLDVDDSGSVSLDELDPQGAKMIRNFNAHVKGVFGDMRTFFNVADENGDQCISRREFCLFCAEHLGYKEKYANKLFTCLDNGKAGIFLIDVDPKSAAAAGMLPVSMALEERKHMKDELEAQLRKEG